MPTAEAMHATCQDFSAKLLKHHYSVQQIKESLQEKGITEFSSSCERISSDLVTIYQDLLKLKTKFAQEIIDAAA